MKIYFSLFFFLFTQTHAQHVSIIPEPVAIKMLPYNFVLSNKTVIVTDDSCKNACDFFNNYLKEYYGFSLQIVKNATSNFIAVQSIKSPAFYHDSEYNLIANSNFIQINSNSANGVFYGIQSLIQLLPTTITSNNMVTIPGVSIQDYPRFGYRGMHLDVSRHFFPISFIKKYINYIALHKMNYFHWHLTDDQGWRIEIKKYPKLTEIGAWRDGTIIGQFPGKGSDNIKHGGFYTQAEIKEIIQYAADRYITIIPEIEMPGHSMAVLAAYPELSTTPNIQPKVPITWGLNGVVNNVFAPTEKSFNFIQDVLTEVINLFPSKWIHIGGDECSKIWWKKDSLSQQIMRTNNLINEDQLQSYFIKRIETFVNSKGKTIIGWDEILEGGLAPNAVVMSWTGEQGGIHAAKEKHQAIMTPGGWCYFDHSQTKNEDSVTIGSYLPLEKVYSYEPIPATLSKEEAKYILGAQGNVWTEYMAYPSKIEYMIFPRISALSEVLWSPTSKKNWNNFENKLTTQIERYKRWKINYSKAYFELQSQIITTKKGIELSLNSKQKNATIFYSLNNNEAKNFELPIVVNNSCAITAFQKIDNEIFGKSTFNFCINKATGKKIIANILPSSAYPGNGGLFSMVNGLKSEKGFNSSEWCGWIAKNVALTIDLAKQTTIKQIAIHVLDQKYSWIHPPIIQGIEVSEDGYHFTELNNINTFNKYNENNVRTIQLNFTATKVQFVKIKISSLPIIPNELPGAGKMAWMFIDEIEINN